MSLRDRVVRVTSQVLNLPVGAITEESSPRTVEGWDSLGHMNLMLALEEEFGVQFSDERILQLLSVGAIVQALRELTGTGDA
ncbi:MAG TPA: acyl carrier protein [Gemmatimonadales bacterium]|nr:acyl carrier protein [Gemmatimonadales bacterium]